MVLAEGLPLLDSRGRRIIICFCYHQKSGSGTGVSKQARDAGLPCLWVGLTGWMSQTPGFPEWVLSGCRESSSLYPKKKLMEACNCPNWEGIGGILEVWANGTETQGKGKQHVSRGP